MIKKHFDSIIAKLGKPDKYMLFTEDNYLRIYNKTNAFAIINGVIWYHNTNGKEQSIKRGQYLAIYDSGEIFTIDEKLYCSLTFRRELVAV